MPIILAIEPDRRQAAHLTALVHRRVKAELILVPTTEGALDAIGNRVPDLMLVPALLSPQDDAALAAALRVIAAAACVQMLTIPVLGPPGPAGWRPETIKAAAPGPPGARWIAMDAPLLSARRLISTSAELVTRSDRPVSS